MNIAGCENPPSASLQRRMAIDGIYVLRLAAKMLSASKCRAKLLYAKMLVDRGR